MTLSDMDSILLIDPPLLLCFLRYVNPFGDRKSFTYYLPSKVIGPTVIGVIKCLSVLRIVGALLHVILV